MTSLAVTLDLDLVLDLALTTPAASFFDVIGTIVGIMLCLAGLSTGLMCLLALTEPGARGRALKGLAAGVGLLLAGLWLVGVIG